MPPFWLSLLLGLTVLLLAEELTMRLCLADRISRQASYNILVLTRGGVLAGWVAVLFWGRIPVGFSLAIAAATVASTVAFYSVSAGVRRVNFGEWCEQKWGAGRSAARLERAMLLGAGVFTSGLLLCYITLRLGGLLLPAATAMQVCRTAVDIALANSIWAGAVYVVILTGVGAFVAGNRLPAGKGLWVGLPGMLLATINPEVSRFVVSPLNQYGQLPYGADQSQFAFFITVASSSLLAALLGGAMGAAVNRGQTTNGPTVAQ